MTDPKKGWLERREYERIKDVLKIAYYPVSNETAAISEDYKDTTIEKLVSNRSANPFTQAFTDDISKGGLSITTGESLAEGQKIVLDLFLPKILKPVKILAEVRRIEHGIKGGSTYKAGLKIVSVSKSDLKRIENHIFTLKNGGF